MVTEPDPGVSHGLGKGPELVTKLPDRPLAGEVVLQHRHARGGGVDRRFAAEHGGGEVAEPAGCANRQRRGVAQRRPAAGHFGKDLPGFKVRQRVPAEDVAAAGLPTGRRRFDAGDDIADVDKVVGPGWCQQPLAAANLQQHPAA